MKKLNDIDLSRVNNIIIGNNELLNISIENNGTTLIIDSNFKPKIVDDNFNEVAIRINKLENEINILKSIVKHE